MKNSKQHVKSAAPGGGAGYFLGFIGALVYYIDVANGFWPVILAFLKACVWPALLVYHVLKFIS